MIPSGLISLNECLLWKIMMSPQVNYVSFCKEYEGEKKENRINNKVNTHKNAVEAQFCT